MIERMIPSTGEKIPAIGLGTWQTFDVKSSREKALLQEVLSVMQGAGSRVIDTSPMYGNSEKVIGELMFEKKAPDNFFYATKVWTKGKQEGNKQMNSSFLKMKRDKIDLFQIHNLLDWQTHLETLREWKSEGKVRYIGITHYTDEMHNTLEKIISTEKIDFVQFNYSIFSTNAEKRLLPAALNYGVATLINRPFGEGALFKKVKNKPLPPWAVDIGIDSWGKFFLSFIIAHPAVTCVIPAWPLSVVPANW